MLSGFMQTQPEQLIAQFILSKRGGICLSYLELEFLKEWIQLSKGDVEELVLLLDDLSQKPPGMKLPLKVFHSRVVNHFRELRLRTTT